MPPTAYTSAAAHQPRSAEQTARFLLSSAFRYDTWECTGRKKELHSSSSGATAITLRLCLREASSQQVKVEEYDGVQLTLFDPVHNLFVGAPYRIDRRELSRALLVQVQPTLVLVAELLRLDDRPTAPMEESRVTRWGSCSVSQLQNGATSISLRPGNGHLLLVDPAVWPAACQLSTPSNMGLIIDINIVTDQPLVQLMAQLVPNAVFVLESFTKGSPGPGATAFSLSVKNVELSGTTDDATRGLADPDADWSVAAVVHNGLQQLCRGVEIPLVIDATQHPPKEGGANSSGSSRSSQTTSSSRDRSEKAGKRNVVPATDVAKHGSTVHSELPMHFDRLPVHSSTSLVLAIRHRAPGTRAYEVLGFCVLPLCMMPLQDRDIRVEGLPALRGPFSCEDARMLMVESNSPYGRVPMTVTLTVEYHDTGVTASTAAALTEAGVSQTPGEGVAFPFGGAASPDMLPGALSSGSSSASSDAAGLVSARPTHVLSTEDAIARPHSPTGVTGPAAPLLSPADLAAVTAQLSAAAAAASPGSGRGDVGIFKLLCTIMEELHQVREAQDALLRQTSGLGGPAALSPAMLNRLNGGLADAPIDIIDLAARPLAASWKARKLMHDDAQPILHPVRGTILDDASPIVGELATSIYGIRLEGITMDDAIKVPADVCFMFSFGPLPHQQVGPMHTVSVEKADACESFKLYDGGRASFVWCEPLEAAQDPAMLSYKSSGNATLYLHLFDALQMFYLATATLPLASFRRPISAECAIMPMDINLQRDLSMTEHIIPSKVFPVMRHAGQLHMTLFCVGISNRETIGAAAVARPAVMRLPGDGANSRVIMAKKLQHVEQLQAGDGANVDGALAVASTATPITASGSNLAPETSEAKEAPVLSSHWQRAHFFKKMLQEQRKSTGAAAMPGVPDQQVEAAQRAAELEFKLRFLEQEREALKTRRIAETLLHRLTIEHELRVNSWRPTTVRTPLQNPFGATTQFFVEVDKTAPADVCEVVGNSNFFLGPRDKTEVVLVVRLSLPQSSYSTAEPPSASQQHITAKVYSEKRELVCCIKLKVTVDPPLVDRRYEIFGAGGSEVTKRVLSRTFSAASFPITSNQAALLERMRELCAYAATSSDRTTATTNAVLDPITQTHITAWEEVTICTEIPKGANRQRIEYITFFYDESLSRVYETWEICIFACDAVMTRDIYWGQTTVLGLPAEGTSDLYCSDASVKVERRGPSYLLRLHPRDAGTQRMLLHTLQDGNLKKTLLTVPTVYPTPSFTQLIELSLADTKGPVWRRLTFVNRGDMEEVFQVHHNYKYNLRISPSKFALAPGDSQYVSLQFDMLSLPPGQLEGRWPMWVFINNNEDKTVESYYLQVVLRAHPVTNLIS